MKTRRSDGFSLVEVLVALAAFGFALAAFVQYTGWAARAKAELREKLDRTATKQTLITSIDCVQTGLCAAGVQVALRREDGSVLIGASPTAPTRFGSYAVMARCVSPTEGIEIRAAKLKVGKPVTSTDPNDYEPDQLSGKVTTFGDAESQLFPAGVNLCASVAPPPTLRIKEEACQWIDPGPVDHCICSVLDNAPAGLFHVMRAWNADAPIPVGMIYKASCECCRLTAE
jgi:prepilin-type N-terminal cleavage/methylation domain-containing protein